MKYLNENPTKQNLYAENYKMLVKWIKYNQLLSGDMTYGQGLEHST
jgi:hypothetical protein